MGKRPLPTSLPDWQEKVQGREGGFNYCSYSYDKKIWLLAAAPFNFRGSPSVSPHTGGKAA
jgi:hypothetical protein